MRLKKTSASFAAIALALFTPALLALPASAADAVPAPAAAMTPQALDALINGRMEEAGIMGLAAAIIVDRKVVSTKGFGYADRERGVPFTPDTVMNIGSITKSVTGAAMMRAVQEGKLSLDADINGYLPFKVANPYHPGEKITLRQLATHTSGITDRWAVYRDTYHYDGSTPEPLGEFLESYLVPGGMLYSKENFLDGKPGSSRDYSNIGAGLAGFIVERATGVRLEEYTRQKLFEPLGMHDTAWHLSGVEAAKHSKLYVSQMGLTIPIQLYSLTTWPDGDLRTSVSDLSKFFVAMLGDGESGGARILDRATTAEMLRFQFTPASKPANVELDELNSGLFWATKRNVTRIGHNGTDPGLKTEMLASLDRGVGVVLMTNTSLSDEDMRSYIAISDALWKYAEAWKRDGHEPGR